MNLLPRQAFLNSITLYIGVALGFINSILFQHHLSLEEQGFYYLLILYSLIYTQLASLGFQGVITRYFPVFKTEDKRHKGFASFALLTCSVSFLIVSLCFILFKELAFSMSSAKAGSTLMSKYYIYIVPLSFFSLSFIFQETFAKANYKNVLPTFLREVFVRVSTTLGVLLIFKGIIGYKGFIVLYVLANGLILLIISFYNNRSTTFKLAGITTEVRSQAGSILHYGFLVMLGGSALTLLLSTSSFALKWLSGEAAVGIYGTFFAFAQVISLPARAINTTSYQIIADAWRNEDLEKINKIYSKTSIIQLLIGALLLIGLIINQRNLLYLLHKPEYARHFYVFIIIGFGFLVDITGGLNGQIIGFSKRYRVQTRILIAIAILSTFISFGLVSRLGLAGAAWSYLISMFLLNFGYWLYLKNKFSLQPFNIKHLSILAIAGLCLLLGSFLPNLDNYYFDGIYRSGLITLVYGFLIYAFKISQDINDLVNKVLRKKL